MAKSRLSGTGPRFIKIGRAVRYATSAVRGSMPPFTAERTQPVVQQQQQVRPRDDDKKE